MGPSNIGIREVQPDGICVIVKSHIPPMCCLVIECLMTYVCKGPPGELADR